MNFETFTIGFGLTMLSIGFIVIFFIMPIMDYHLKKLKNSRE